MTLVLLLSLAPPMVVAYSLIRLLSGAALPNSLRLSLACGLGIGLGSCSLFAWLIVVGLPDNSFIAFECFVAIAMSVAAGLKAWRVARSDVRAHTSAASASPEDWPVVLTCCLLVAFGAALVATVAACRQEPHGAWDGWAIWNLRARFLFRGGRQWQEGLCKALVWSHPDYPLMLPGAVARSWYYAGTDGTLVPVVLALLFAFGTVAMLVSAVASIRGLPQAALAGLALLGSQYFVRHAAYQYADTPLSFFMLAAVVLVHRFYARAGRRQGLLRLAGLMMGMAAWTKNEGLLFAMALGLAQWIVSMARAGRRLWIRQFGAVLAGALPMLMIVAYFKARYAASNDLMATWTGSNVCHRLADPERYWEIVVYLAKVGLEFSHGWLLVLFIYVWLMGAAPLWRKDIGLKIVGVSLVLVLVGYFFVYVLSPYDLAWHMGTSSRRLLLQLLAPIVFVLFVGVSTPAEAMASRSWRLR